ncbi:transcription termination factor 1 isoform X1 [Danio rerio]|uniref:Si:ch73-37h15.2 n=1 Tax=Danio rerio TaxID=7955 RepID=F1Q786_DANRE|nr:transcription termination factor 1 [Danio rerio]|eukprot:XP_005168698.1 transcription termination factor 1 [Danio rerio]
MDEMPSLSSNARVDGEKVKKKRSKPTEQHELTESPQEQAEKRLKKKEKMRNSIRETDINLQIKKRRKLDDEGETPVLDDGVSNQHEAQTQELQGSREGKTSKRKKMREKLKQTNCEDMAKQQTDIRREHEDEPNTSDHERGLLDIMMGTKTRKTKQLLSDEPLVDLNALDELNQFCPKITLASRSARDINKMIRIDLPRFKEFRKQGIELRHGRFSTAENERLRQNVSNFLALTGVKDAIKLFHPKRFPKESQTLANLKRKYSFFVKIAEGIPRPCHDVYTRGTKIYDDRNKKGNFTEEEEKSLLKYYTLYGPDWKKISDKTDRSSYSLEKRFSHLSKIRGPWTTNEVQRLLRAVRDHVVSVLKSANPKKKKPKRVSREILYQALPWSKIAEKVKTRCWTKCRDKWMSILASRMSSGITFRGRKAQEAKIKLIRAMYEMQVEDVVDVDWEHLTAVFGDVPPAYAQSRWHQLKVCYVPDWQNKCFGDIVDFLYENTLPGLVKECKDLDDDELTVDQMNSFRLADIFQDINEDECCDDDEQTGQQENNHSS